MGVLIFVFLSFPSHFPFTLLLFLWELRKSSHQNYAEITVDCKRQLREKE